MTTLNPLLQYAIITDPFPPEASPESGSLNVIDSMTIVATNSSPESVTLQGISISIPVGTGAAQLTNDPSSINTVKPDNWQVSVQQPAGYVVYVFTPNAGYGTLMAQSSLLFIFQHIPVNQTAGSLNIGLTEGSGQCNPPNCPVIQLPITKFPNNWGAVTFDAPASIKPGGSVSLAWGGPSGATYSIEYYDAKTDKMITIPAQGGTPLSNNGVYPGSNDPALQPIQTTVYTLNVAQTINNIPYSTQEQKTVTVQVPAQLQVHVTSSSAVFGAGDSLVLTWSTVLADSCSLSIDTLSPAIDIGAANLTARSCTITCTDAQTLTITAADGTSLGQITLPTQIPCNINIRLTASNQQNQTTEAEILITLAGPQIPTFSVSNVKFDPSTGWNFTADYHTLHTIFIANPDPQIKFPVQGPFTVTGYSYQDNLFALGAHGFFAPAYQSLTLKQS